MRPARKGDGTGLSFPGYSEVRKGDGTVLWTEGPDIPDSVVDDFEENRLANYGGSTGRAGLVTSPVIEGTQALEITGGAFGDGITSTSGLPNYPAQGRETQTWFRFTDGGQSLRWWYYADEEGNFPNNAYGLRLDAKLNEFAVRLRNGGAASTVGETSFSWSIDTWYKAIGTWRDDDVHDWRVEDVDGNELASISPTDATHSGASGVGVGFVNNSATDTDSPAYFDGCFTTT